MDVMSKTEIEIAVPPSMAPLMERHRTRAAEAVTELIADCETDDECLGALAVLALILMNTVDAIRSKSQN